MQCTVFLAYTACTCTVAAPGPTIIRPAGVNCACLLRRFDIVVHFAGRKAVGESVQHPMLYYTHNLLGSTNLLEVMRKHNCKNVRRGSDCSSAYAQQAAVCTR